MFREGDSHREWKETDCKRVRGREESVYDQTGSARRGAK